MPGLPRETLGAYWSRIFPRQMSLLLMPNEVLKHWMHARRAAREAKTFLQWQQSTKQTERQTAAFKTVTQSHNQLQLVGRLDAGIIKQRQQQRNQLQLSAYGSTLLIFIRTFHMAHKQRGTKMLYSIKTSTKGTMHPEGSACNSHCVHAELTSKHALASCCSCCMHCRVYAN